MQWVVNAYLLAPAAFLAVALALAFLCALRHSGTRVTDEPASAGTAAGVSAPGPAAGPSRPGR